MRHGSGQVTTEVAIDVFGGLTVRWGNVERPIGGPRQRRLLATLIVERDRVVSAARLAEAVWRGEDLPHAADRTLQTYVSRLRNTLGEHAVAREHGGYRLKGAAVVVSSDRFIDAVRAAHSARSGPAENWLTAVDAALALWRGQPYGDLSVEPFLVGEANRLADCANGPIG